MITRTTSAVKRKAGQKMTVSERTDFIARLMEELLNGYQSDYKLVKTLDASYDLIKKYKPEAMKLIAVGRIDQPQIRALQMQRLYQDLENLTVILEDAIKKHASIRDLMSIYNQRSKVNQQIALVAGLNIETKINVDQRKLIITRAHPDAVQEALHPENNRKVIEMQQNNDNSTNS